MKILLLILLSFCSIAHADSVVWNKTDRALMVSYAALSGIDAVQTDNGLQRGCRELNPAYGGHPSTERILLTKLVLFGLVYLIADNYPEARRPGLIVLNALQGAVILNNSRY